MRRFFRRWPAQSPRAILASLLDPFLDLVFPIKHPHNPRHNLALSFQTEDHSIKSHRTKVAFFSSLNWKAPLPSRERDLPCGVRSATPQGEGEGGSSAKMLEGNSRIQ